MTDPRPRAVHPIKGRFRRSFERALVRGSTLTMATIVRNVPLRWVHRIGNFIGSLLVATGRKRQRLADRNIKAVFGERLTPAERRCVRVFSARNVAKTMFELFRLPVMSDEEFDALVEVRHLEHLHAAVATGRGVIIVTGHFGAWEMLSPVLGRTGYTINAVARDSGDASTATVINTSRASEGTNVISRDDVRGMLRALRAGEVMVILPDQHAKRGGIVVDFMGLPASTFTGPTVMAMRADALLVPAFVRRTDADHLICEFGAPFEAPQTGDREADVIAGTQMVNDVIAREIFRRPGQWLWLHDRWRPNDRLELDPDWAPPEPGKS